jgi:hypothetical protein
LPKEERERPRHQAISMLCTGQHRDAATAAVAVAVSTTAVVVIYQPLSSSVYLTLSCWQALIDDMYGLPDYPMIR